MKNNNNKAETKSTSDHHHLLASSQTQQQRRLHWLEPAQCTSLQLLDTAPDTAVAGCSDGTLRILHPDGRTTIACHLWMNDDNTTSNHKNNGTTSTCSSSSSTTTKLSKLPVLVATAGNRIFAALARGSTACVAVEFTTTSTAEDDAQFHIQHVHRHADAKLRGLGAAAQQQHPQHNDATILLTGLGIQNLHVYRFSVEKDRDTGATTSAYWQCLLDTPTNGNTLRWLSFGTGTRTTTNAGGTRTIQQLQAITHSSGHLVQVWELEDCLAATTATPPVTHKPRHRAIPDTQDCLAVHDHRAYCTVNCLPHVVHVVPLDVAAAGGGTTHTTMTTACTELCLPLQHDDNTNGNHDASHHRTSRRRRRLYRSITHVTWGTWCHVSDGSVWNGVTGQVLWQQQHAPTTTTSKSVVVAANHSYVALATDKGCVQLQRVLEEPSEAPAVATTAVVTESCRRRDEDAAPRRAEPPVVATPVASISSSTQRIKLRKSSTRRPRRISMEGAAINRRGEEPASVESSHVDPKSSVSGVVSGQPPPPGSSHTGNNEETALPLALTDATAAEQTNDAFIREAVAKQAAPAVQPLPTVAPASKASNEGRPRQLPRHQLPLAKKKTRKSKKRIQPEPVNSPLQQTKTEPQLPTIIPPLSAIKTTRVPWPTLPPPAAEPVLTDGTVTPAKRPALAVLVSNTKEDATTRSTSGSTHKKKRRCTDWQSPQQSQQRTPRQRLDSMADSLAAPRDAAGRWAQAVVAAVQACLRQQDPGSIPHVIHRYGYQAAQLERRLELEAVCRKWRRDDTVNTTTSIGVWCQDVLERVQVVLAGEESAVQCAQN